MSSWPHAKDSGGLEWGQALGGAPSLQYDCAQTGGYCFHSDRMPDKNSLQGAGFTLAYSSENTVLHVEGIVAGEVAGSVSGVDGSHLKALGWDRSQLIAFKPHPCPLLLCISFHKYPRECHQLGTKCSRRDTAPPPPDPAHWSLGLLKVNAPLVYSQKVVAELTEK